MNITFFTLVVFTLTVLFLIWRPRGINESIPTTIGACLIILAGVVPFSDIYRIGEIVSGAAITIISTIIMSIVLDSIGFFRWAAYNLVRRSKGSGTLLFLYINALCFLMTMFFNNDGSILITTPIIIQIVNLLRLKNHQKIPFLLSGALIATSSSAPIGVSNLANLIALKIVGLDLNSYAKLMFVPSMIGIITICGLLYVYFQKDIPRRIHIPYDVPHSNPLFYKQPYHPLMEDNQQQSFIDWKTFNICISMVILTRCSFFIAPSFGIPIEWVATVGALLLIAVRWYRKRMGIHDIIKQTPWHIILFAFSIYVVVYALHNIGLTNLIVERFKGVLEQSSFNAVFVTGLLVSVMSNLFNNLPSVMLGTLSLTQMGLDLQTLQIAYLANIIGSDIGSLITPMGTLASLIWMHILRINKVKMTWREYIKVSILVIPIGLLMSLLSLYFWSGIFF